MSKQVSTSLRNRVADARVENLDALELFDSSGSVIADATGISWNAAGAQDDGAVYVSGTPTLTGTAAAAGGADAVEARYYDDAGSSGDELSGLVVAQGTSPSAWSLGTSYTQGDLVSNTLSGVQFFFRADSQHSASADTEPGAGKLWPGTWTLVDILIENTNIVDGQTIDITVAAVVEPSLLQ
jgi:hypothetical protein